MLARADLPAGPSCVVKDVDCWRQNPPHQWYRCFPVVSWEGAGHCSNNINTEGRGSWCFTSWGSQWCLWMQEVLRVGESRLGMALAWALSFSVSPNELSSFEGGAENLLYLLPSLSLSSLAAHLVWSSLTFCAGRQQVVPGVWQNAGGWGAFLHVQGRKCCYHVKL